MGNNNNQKNNNSGNSAEKREPLRIEVKNTANFHDEEELGVN